MSKHKGFIEIELDKPRRLKYDWNAVAEIEDRHDTSLIELMEAISEKKIGRLRIALWGGLIHEDESLTLKQVGEMINFENFTHIMEKVTEAIQISDSAGVSTKKK